VYWFYLNLDGAPPNMRGGWDVLKQIVDVSHPLHEGKEVLLRQYNYFLPKQHYSSKTLPLSNHSGFGKGSIFQILRFKFILGIFLPKRIGPLKGMLFLSIPFAPVTL
jgi:hypothetical protein